MQIGANIFDGIAIVCSIFVFVILLLLFFVLLYRKSHNSFLNEKELMKNRYAQVLLESQAEIQELTQSALAKELHDNVGQLISSAKMLVGVARRYDEHTPQALDRVDETLAEAVEALRSLSKSLDKDWLNRFSLLENLFAEIRRINSTQRFTIDISHPDTLSLNGEKEIVLFRIIQECLQNIIKHADAEKIALEIAENGSHVHVSISDNGKGFLPGNASANGMGIQNIRNRTCLLKGSAAWTSEPGRGTCVTIVIPIYNSLL